MVIGHLGVIDEELEDIGQIVANEVDHQSAPVVNNFIAQVRKIRVLVVLVLVECHRQILRVRGDEAPAA